jgi:hypothetical protein
MAIMTISSKEQEREELFKCLIRYGKILKDINFNKTPRFKQGTDRILIMSYDHEIYYIHMCMGNIIECHKLDR